MKPIFHPYNVTFGAKLSFSKQQMKMSKQMLKVEIVPLFLDRLEFDVGIAL